MHDENEELADWLEEKTGYRPSEDEMVDPEEHAEREIDMEEFVDCVKSLSFEDGDGYSVEEMREQLRGDDDE